MKKRELDNPVKVCATCKWWKKDIKGECILLSVACGVFYHCEKWEAALTP